MQTEICSIVINSYFVNVILSVSFLYHKVNQSTHICRTLITNMCVTNWCINEENLNLCFWFMPFCHFQSNLPIAILPTPITGV